MSTFRDIIKKSVLESFTGSSITTMTVCVTLGITVILALYIFVVYYIDLVVFLMIDAKLIPPPQNKHDHHEPPSTLLHGAKN